MGFCGDSTWMPCGLFVGPNDIDLFAEDIVPQQQPKKPPPVPETDGSSAPVVNGDKNVSVNGSGAATDLPSDSTGQNARGGDDVPMAESSHAGTNGETRPPDGTDKEESLQKDMDTSEDIAPEEKQEAPVSAVSEKPATQESGDSNEKATNAEGSKKDETDRDRTADIGMQDAGNADPANADATGRDANVKLEHGVPSSDPGDDFIHPFFNPPAYPLPDRDMGLPENEAENVRHLVSLYVQKQEEIARGAAKLYQGLMKADRLRRTVLQWAKAEAHVGEMSDGEDWYDKEEWRLEGDLKKGQDEEEEDTTQSVKKTRNRRQ